MSHPLEAGPALFSGGPPDKLLRLLLRIRDGRPHLLRRCLIFILIAWVPLLLLAALHGDLVDGGGWNPFLFDFGAQTRYLIVPPLLILAEGFCAPRLAALAGQFFDAGLVNPPDYPRYQEARVSTGRLMNSTAAEVIALALAYVLVAVLFFSHSLRDVPGWHGVHKVGGGFTFYPAGWWAVLVSLPLLLLLELGWLWRLYLWARFLWLMNRLDLRLVAAHPDHAAGLRFLAYSLRTFVPLGFVFGVIAAGAILNKVVHQGASPLQFKYLMGGTALVALVLLAGPVFFFVFRLMEAQRQGMITYGTLATRMGEQFEAKWFKPGARLGSEALEDPDFSSTTDLYSITANVYAMQIVPLELKSLAMLATATVLPFLPVALLAAPLDVLLKKAAGLFF